VAANQLRLVASPGQLPALKLALKNAAAKTNRRPSLVTATYYDSPDLKLRRQSLSVYVQEQGARRVQGLRRLGYVNGGGTAAGEWWDPINADRPDPAAAMTGSRLRAILDDGELCPLFKTQLRRTFHKVSTDPSFEIAVALEEGQLCAASGSAAESVCALELELKRGDPAALYDIALRLLDAAPFRIETQSLPERGYRLLGAAFEAATSKPLAFEPSMTVEAVLQSVARECTGHLLRNEAAAISGDAEAVHQMRVASRRLRSMLSAVKSMLPVEQYRWLQEELKWLAGSLAPVRNWDVFATDLLAPVRSALPADANLEQLAEATKRRRQAVYDTAREAIGSRRYVELMLKLSRWFASRAWRDQPASERSAPLFAPIGNVAPPLIERRWRQVRKRSRRFAALSQEERHNVRIALKKFRYMTEFLGSLFHAREVNALMKRLKALQEDLGHVNDVRTAQRLINEIDRPADKDANALSQQAGLVIGWHLRELTHTEARLRRDVRRFRNAKPFWRPAQPATAPVIVIDAASPSLSTQANGRRGVFVRGEGGQRQRMDAGGEFGGEGLIDEPLARDAALASKGG
jgi:triphosphatase